jgi:hypothetical protein
VRAVRWRRRTSSARFFAAAKMPGGWIFGHAAEFPPLHGAAEGILHDILCQREVVDTEDPRESGYHPPGFAPKERSVPSGAVLPLGGGHQGDRKRRPKVAKRGPRKPYMLSFSTGRTSTDPPTSRRGQSFESSTACVMSLASMSIKPHTTSLASAKGPS